MQHLNQDGGIRELPKYESGTTADLSRADFMDASLWSLSVPLGLITKVKNNIKQPVRQSAQRVHRLVPC